MICSCALAGPASTKNGTVPPLGSVQVSVTVSESSRSLRSVGAEAATDGFGADAVALGPASGGGPGWRPRKASTPTTVAATRATTATTPRTISGSRLRWCSSSGWAGSGYGVGTGCTGAAGASHGAIGVGACAAGASWLPWRSAGRYTPGASSIGGGAGRPGDTVGYPPGGVSSLPGGPSFRPGGSCDPPGGRSYPDAGANPGWVAGGDPGVVLGVKRGWASGGKPAWASGGKPAWASGAVSATGASAPRNRCAART